LVVLLIAGYFYRVAVFGIEALVLVVEVVVAVVLVLGANVKQLLVSVNC